MRKSVLAIAIILVLTPACKEEKPNKQYPKVWQNEDSKPSKTGMEIIKIYDKLIVSGKKTVKGLEAAKAKLQTKRSSSLVSEKTINEALNLQRDALNPLVPDQKLIHQIHILLTAARKNNTLTEADTVVMSLKGAKLKVISKKLLALHKETSKAIVKAQMAINESVKARLRELHKQLSK